MPKGIVKNQQAIREQIYTLLKAGESQKEVCKKTGACPSLVGQVARTALDQYSNRLSYKTIVEIVSDLVTTNDSINEIRLKRKCCWDTVQNVQTELLKTKLLAEPRKNGRPKKGE